MSTILVTGATSGIGKATALQLSKLGHHVVVHGRTRSGCEAAAQEIFEATKNPVDAVFADLSDMTEVTALVSTVQTKFPNLNVLINNAGTFSPTRLVTKDGFEKTWAVNYLSRFVLTNGLLETLKKNRPSRIVDVSGTYHSKGQIHFDDIGLETGYSLGAANNQAKLANVLFTYKLARTLDGQGVTCNTLHPGAVKTDSILKVAGIPSFTKWMYNLFSVFFKTPEEGAATSVFLATSPHILDISGKYFVNQKAVRSGTKTYDTALQDRLWEISAQMSGPTVSNL